MIVDAIDWTIRALATGAVRDDVGKRWTVWLQGI